MIRVHEDAVCVCVCVGMSFCSHGPLAHYITTVWNMVA